MRTGRVAALAALLTSMAVPSAAGDPELPRVSVSLGAGIATPFHGDLQFNAAAWQASVRAAVAPHVLIEGFYGEWRHATNQVTTNTVVQGPNGVLGRIDRVTQRTEYVRPGIGFNVLAAGTAGRVTYSAGGGPGVLLYQRRFSQSFEGCQGDFPCTNMENRFTSASFMLQATAGVDVAVAPRIAVYGAFHLAAPIEDVGAGQTAVLGGVRVRLW